MKKFIALLMMSWSLSAYAASDAVTQQLEQYRKQGAVAPSAERGEAQWRKVFQVVNGKQRSCESCHGKDLKQAGKHAKTGKTIDAIAPSVNAERLTEVKKIEKWFKRNCKWTLGRECSVQEKADYLAFLMQQ